MGHLLLHIFPFVNFMAIPLSNKFLTYVMILYTYNTQIDPLNSASTWAERGDTLV